MTDETFQRLYDAEPFDPTDRHDMMAETARRMLIDTFRASLQDLDAQSGEDVQAILAGLMVGIACVTACQMPISDQSHAAIRSGVIEMVPFSVDMMRDIINLPPLPTD